MKNSVLFMGLFLMMFALYANERSKPPVRVVGNPTGEPEIVDSPEAMTDTPVVESTSTDAPVGKYSPKVQELFEKFSSDTLFLKDHADGLRMSREPHAMMIQFYGEDVFADGEVAMRESWYSALDRIASKLSPEEFKKGLKIEVRGFADETSLREQRPSDFGNSAYSFSFARGEWLARYFERKWRMPLAEVFTIKAMGARPNGKKVELWLSF